jgi:hypothetical protein
MKDSQKNYQMKRRRYGYGWTPVTLQSWLFIGLELVIILTAASFLPAKPAQPTLGELLRFFAILGAAIGTLLIFTYQTSPKAKWRWGKKQGDNPEEDF